MGIISFPLSDIDSRKLSDILDHQYCKSSSSSQTPIAINNIVSGDMKIQIPSSTRKFKAGNGQGDPETETPRSMEHRIQVMGTCPPAPRKAKRVPTTGKRRASCFPVVRVPADFVVYLNAMLALNEVVYVPDIVVGDLGADDHAKRLKLSSPPAHEL